MTGRGQQEIVPLRGWEGGWILQEAFFVRLDNLWGRRFSVFLHHDGGNPSTGGCIGLKNAKDVRELRNILGQVSHTGAEKRID